MVILERVSFIGRKSIPFCLIPVRYGHVYGRCNVIHVLHIALDWVCNPSVTELSISSRVAGQRLAPDVCGLAGHQSRASEFGLPGGEQTC